MPDSALMRVKPTERKIRKKYYRGFKVYVAIDLQTKALLYIDFVRISANDSEKLIPIVKAVAKLKKVYAVPSLTEAFGKGTISTGYTSMGFCSTPYSNIIRTKIEP